MAIHPTDREGLQAIAREREVHRLQDLVLAMEQLMIVQDQAVLQQSDHLEAMLHQMQRYNDRLLTSQRELGDQKRHLQSILDNMSDGVVVADNKGRFVQFNPAAEAILGASRMEIDLEEWSREYAMFLPDKVTPFPPADLPLARALQGEDVDDERIYVRRQMDLPGIWITVNGRPLRGEKGMIRGGIAVFRDITREKHSVELLERLSAVVEQTDDTVFVTDHVGTITYVNPAFEITTGYSRGDAIGRTPRLLKSGEHNPVIYKDLWQTILSGRVFRESMINCRKDGALFYCEQTITPMKDRDGNITHFVAVLKDMTNRRRILAQEFELKMASVVQKKLYPENPPSWAGLDVAGAVFPAEATCGDYFDYLTIADQVQGVAIGDVSGHGLGPALVMAEARAYLRSLVTEVRDHARLFSKLNQILLSDLEDERFLSLVLITVDMKRRQLNYANAGHLPGYVLDRAGEVKTRLMATGPPLGILPDLSYESSPSVAMEPGDLVLLVTDGITESAAPDGSFFEMDAVLRVVRQNQHLPAKEIIASVQQAVSLFSQNQRQIDDMTIVVLKVLPDEGGGT